MHQCANIGPQGQRFRLVYGSFALAVAVVMAGLLARAPWWQRALVFLPLIGASLGVFQYLEKT